MTLEVYEDGKAKRVNAEKTNGTFLRHASFVFNWKVNGNEKIIQSLIGV